MTDEPPPRPDVIAPQKTNPLAVASLVLGILWIDWIGSVAAVILGYVAKRQIDRSGGLMRGRGMAVAGIVLGWVAIGLLVLVLFVFGGLDVRSLRRPRH